MHKIHLLLVVITTIFSVNFSAQATALSHIIVSDAYIRASIPGTSNSSAYMRIDNNDEKTVTLVKVSSKISARIEIHNHVMKNGMMQMRQLQHIDITANSRVILQPHGMHLMFFDLIAPINTEDTIEVTLHFSNKDTLTVALPVKSLK